jgi:2,4-dienoyl-CoA reductase-like NADH-dependent reductase (Old Yellow Enzyme family)
MRDWYPKTPQGPGMYRPPNPNLPIHSASLIDNALQLIYLASGLSFEDASTFRSSEIAATTGIDELLERLEREEFDLVAIGRSLIVNPTWPQIIQPGAIDELLPYQRDVLAQLI